MTKVPLSRPSIIFIAGFGDNATMFDGLRDTDLAESHVLLLLNLPGFGAPATETETSLTALAKFVAEKAQETDAKIIVAHSVASIIASLAAMEPNCPISAIMSLEGNITADDAYFSGMAGDYDDPNVFRDDFLRRLDEMVQSKPEIARYRMAVEHADPVALWQLGCDARRFSAEHVPGDLLLAVETACYFHNPENCPRSTLNWLDANPIKRIVLQGATHWASVDQPKQLANKISQALA